MSEIKTLALVIPIPFVMEMDKPHPNYKLAEVPLCLDQLKGPVRGLVDLKRPT
ncbi:MAG: hypothetical protein IH991_05685 [Planctomycetes bacterium]|nr:hypothetical protein [Planctomycetota bacterium]